MWQHPRRPTPNYLKVVKPNFSWPVSLVFFLISDQGYYTFHYRYSKHNWEEKEQTNKHGLGSAPSARKGVCDTLHSPCICRLSRACILRETSKKATWNANSSLTVFYHCLLLLTIFPLDCYLTLTGLFCPPLSTGSLSSLRPSFSPPLSVSQEISSSVLCAGFAPKQTKRSSEWHQHKRKRIATHCVTEVTSPH